MNDRELATQILKSMSVPYASPTQHDELRGVYFVLPAGERVSFWSQQIRALNFVWAFNELGLAQREARIAVVGAGVTGVTLACSLAALGHFVKLLDKAATPMWRQADTRHRVVHPNLNLWPHLNQTLLPITDFPFLNWHYGDCNRIIHYLREDFDRFVHKFPAHLSFEGLREVKTIAHNDSGIALVTDKGDPLGEFDFVVFSTGFEAEPCAVKQHKTSCDHVEYWCADNLERIIRRGQIANFVVVGAGDGGLIEAIRLLIPNFDCGRLPVKIAYELNILMPAIVQAIAKAELHGASFDQKRDAYDKIIEKLRSDEATLSILEKLAGHVYEGGYQVHLLDNKESYAWTSASAAPIHKLLIAFLLSRFPDRISFKKATLGVTTQDAPIEEPPVAAGKAKKKRVGYTVLDRILPADTTKHISRSGAKRSYPNALPKRVRDDLESKTKDIAGYTVLEHYEKVRHCLEARDLPNEHLKNMPEYFAYRRRIIEAAWREFDPNAVAFIEDGEIWLDTTSPIDPPKRIFDINIKRGIPQTNTSIVVARAVST